MPAPVSFMTLTGLLVMKAPSAAPQISTTSNGCHSRIRWPPDARNPMRTLAMTTTKPMITNIGRLLLAGVTGLPRYRHAPPKVEARTVPGLTDRSGLRAPVAGLGAELVATARPAVRLL